MTEDITGFMVVAPSIVAVGETFAIRIKALTEPYIVGPDHPEHSEANRSLRGAEYMDNVPASWPGAVRIESDGHGLRGPQTFSFPGGTRPIARIEGFSFAAPGVKVLIVRDEASAIEARSNPIQVQAGRPELRLFWGDIHCHTIESDGLRTPDQVCRFAREEGMLDIFAIADHGALPNAAIEQAIESHHSDGRFVTLHADELDAAGHVNVYYPDRPGRHVTKREHRAGELVGAARDAGAMLVRHHTAAIYWEVDWDVGYAPDIMRLIEIYSAWGSSECSEADGNPRPIRALGGECEGQHVRDALNRGFRLGFIASSDSHDGRPGDDMMRLQTSPKLLAVDYDKLERQGIMGVWAEALTREAIWDAMRKRCVYATTNVRVILKFSINGRPMGSELASAGTNRLEIEAHSEDAIARVDVIKDGAVLRSFAPEQSMFAAELDDAVQGGTSWYYVRLTRTDGEMAWSSPIWVTGR